MDAAHGVCQRLFSGLHMVLSASRLLTDLSLVVQVELSIFICRANTRKGLISHGGSSLSILSLCHTCTHYGKPKRWQFICQRCMSTASMLFTLTTAEQPEGKDTKQLIMTGVFPKILCVCFLKGAEGGTKWEVQEWKVKLNCMMTHEEEKYHLEEVPKFPCRGSGLYLCQCPTHLSAPEVTLCLDELPNVYNDWKPKHVSEKKNTESSMNTVSCRAMTLIDRLHFSSPGPKRLLHQMMWCFPLCCVLMQNWIWKRKELASL